MLALSRDVLLTACLETSPRFKHVRPCRNAGVNSQSICSSLVSQLVLQQVSGLHLAEAAAVAAAAYVPQQASCALFSSASALLLQATGSQVDAARSSQLAAHASATLQTAHWILGLAWRPESLLGATDTRPGDQEHTGRCASLKFSALNTTTAAAEFSLSGALQMALETRAGMEAGVIGGGHRYAARRLDAQRSTAGWVAEQMGGLSYLQYIRQLVPRIDSDWPSVQVS